MFSSRLVIALTIVPKTKETRVQPYTLRSVSEKKRDSTHAV